MASTPDLCEGVLYLFPIQIQNEFITRYKSLKSFIIIIYLIQLFLNYFSFTFYLHTFITITDILRVVATEDLQIKLVNIFLQNNSMLALNTYFLSAYIYRYWYEIKRKTYHRQTNQKITHPTSSFKVKNKTG